MESHKIELMDGGFLYELRKYYPDWGEHIIDNNPEIIEKIHQDYINIGCKYITSGNYVFKPYRQPYWDFYTEKVLNILYSLKSNNNFILLGSIPPYYESYQLGEFNENVSLYYSELKDIVSKYADKFIIETIVCPEHLYNICKILDNSLPIIVSIYPNNNINKDHLKYIASNYNIEAILINCCDFFAMLEYYNNTIAYLNDLKNIKGELVKFGFYLNKINEQEYKKTRNNIENNTMDLEIFYIEDNSDLNKIKLFLDNYTHSNNLLIGGCCGYGIEEMKQLKNIIFNKF